MKVEIKIEKKDLRSIFCAAIRNYYCEVKLHLEPNNIYPWQPNKLDEDITDNLYDIHSACDAIADLCDMIDEIDTVEPNDAIGVIRFDDSEEEQK